MHPAPRATVLGRNLGLEESEQRLGVVDALHQGHFAAEVTAERRLERGLDVSAAGWAGPGSCEYTSPHRSMYSPNLSS